MYMTANQVAERLRLDKSLITRYARHGRIKARLIDGEWLLDEDSVIEFADTVRYRRRPRVKA